MIVENLRWGVAIAVLSADVGTSHDQDACAIRMAEVARLGFML